MNFMCFNNVTDYILYHGVCLYIYKICEESLAAVSCCFHSLARK